MIPVKVQCVCGQKFAFDVEPLNGRMPTQIACPVGGADGTVAANDFIAQSLGFQPASGPLMAPAIAAAPPPLPAALPPPSAVPRLAPPPPPVRATAIPTSTTVRPGMRAAIPQKSKHGKDGWATEETGFHK